ncbi:hypothetical protein [Amycolatopsis sp. lyj-84]|uniref:hypothetical protein n=1 Tax=Amycolatopsis sp. lyj-84 TaxID=2789284 RepID=UPI00397C843F
MEIAVIVGLAMLVGAGSAWLASSRWHQRRRAELVQFAQANIQFAQAAWEYARYVEYVSTYRHPPRPSPPFLG